MRLAEKVDVRYIGGTLLSHVDNGTVTDDPANIILSATVRNGAITCDLCGHAVPSDSWKRMDAHMEIHSSVRAGK